MTETSKKNVSVWLVISFAVNALLIGLIIGGGLGNRRIDKDQSRIMGGGEAQLAMGITDAMTGQEKAAFQKAIRIAYLESRNKREALNAARSELNRQLIADPYDQAAVEAAFERLRAADIDVKLSLHQELAGQFGALSLEQRQAIMKSLQSGRRFSGPRRRDRPGGGPPRGRPE